MNLLSVPYSVITEIADDLRESNPKSTLLEILDVDREIYSLLGAAEALCEQHGLGTKFLDNPLQVIYEAIVVLELACKS